MADIRLIVILLVIVMLPILCGSVCFLIARERQLREPGWWFFVGGILGPLAWIAAAFWRTHGLVEPRGSVPAARRSDPLRLWLRAQIA